MPTPEARRVHHHEHRRQALVRLADQRSRSRRRASSGRSRCRGCPSCARAAVQKIGLRAPSLPSASTRNFGTTNSEMPFEPAGASGSRASTRWMMFSARSCSPAEMKILLPGEAVAAVGLRLGLGAQQAEVGAAVRLGQAHRAGPLAADELGQVGRLLLVACRARAALRTRRASGRDTSSRPGWRSSASPRSTGSRRAAGPGRRRPGRSDSDGQPPSTNWSQASLKPFGVVTACVAPSSLQPSASPLWLSGERAPRR